VKKKIKTLLYPGKKQNITNAKENQEISPLTKEQLEQIYQLAFAQAIKFGISQDKAEKMSHALIGSIALAK
jgi:hypothetical protein